MENTKNIELLNEMTKEQLETLIALGYSFVIESGKITEVIK